MLKKTLLAAMLAVVLSWGAQGFYSAVQGNKIQQFTPAPYTDAEWIYFSNGIRFNINQGEPVLPSAQVVEKSEYYIVHLKGPVYNEYTECLSAVGAKVYSYMSNYTFIVRMNETVKHEVAQLEFVDWIGIYQPAYKISGQKEFKDLSGVGKIRILLYPDASLDGVIAYLEQNNGKITDIAETEWDKLINVEIDLALVPNIVKIEEVSWVEPWHQMQLFNSNCQWIYQTCVNGNRKIWNLGIRGNGELVSTSDSGVRTRHYAFRSDSLSWITSFGHYPTDRKIVAYQPANGYGSGYADFGDESGLYYHGTHTAGTVCGDDTFNAADARDGVALKARLFFLDGGGSQGGIYLYPNLNTLFNVPYTGNEAGSVKIMSNSWGTDNGGAYDGQCAQSDQFMWSHKDFLLLFANGNAGSGTNTVGTPAGAKNCVSVGSCRSGTQYATLSTFSSRGPCDDGRRKPTVLGPGQTIYSAYGGSDTQYAGMDGTSMSSPGAAGAAVLARQYFTDGWYPSGSANPADSIAPSAALLKAVLVNGADNSMNGFTVPDNNIGWGRIDLDSVLFFDGDTRKLAVVDEPTGLTTGQYLEYTYEIASNVVAFRIALVWTDYPGAVGSGRKLINDLHLTVTDPNTVEYRGNVYSGGQSTPGGNYDTLNVEECVRINTPTTGTWTVRVSAYNCPQGPQPFALVVTGDLDFTGIVEDRTELSTPAKVLLPVPNPFVSTTCISFTSSKPENVKISIYDITGKLVSTAFDGKSKTGINNIVWDGKDSKGKNLASGVYFFTLETKSQKTTGKLLITR